MIIPSIKEDQKPSAYELALLAAALAKSSPAERQDQLILRAWELWGEALVLLRQVRGIEEDFVYDSLPHCFFRSDVHDLPITRDMFFKVTLVQKRYRTGELASVARAYIGAKLRRDLQRIPTQDEVSEHYAQWKPMRSFEKANKEAENFVTWYREVFIKEKRRKAGQQSGAKRANRRPKKS